MTTLNERNIGPILFFRGFAAGRLQLAALVIQCGHCPVPSVSDDTGPVAAESLAQCRDIQVLRYCLSLPARSGAAYRYNGARYALNADFQNDLRIAFVACNGKERGDQERDPVTRNALWRRLGSEHARAPFQLLLHGGDQLYADEMLDAHAVAQDWIRQRDLSPPDSGTLAIMEQRLRADLFQRYAQLYAQNDPSWLMARVPSLCIWDDHDICDGWGSLTPEQLDHPVGQSVFRVARECFLLFQQASTAEALPQHFLDRSGTSLSWSVRTPGLSIIAPDLRSERRPDRVMGPHGHRALRQALHAARGDRILLLSSVPALGPRLSWIEKLLMWIPKLQKYEDDLRDQWQSRAHRVEWQSFLRDLIESHGPKPAAVTALSGEIHLATRGTLDSAAGPLHQLVSSGVAHPPPPEAYARALGWLARFGESPLPNHRLRLLPLPGLRDVYTAERNYLVLERQRDAWSAAWELEHSGRTPALRI
ncbi:alkaline phosphatase D family protein [Algiphilus sp.]|uniref:alkaline phosphatase D family protein n=1 Tax=Algiphilus sp. TaxID=1872431 RepID=UPI003B5303EA